MADAKQYKDSSSVDNKQAMGSAAKRDAAYLRSTKLGNAAHGGRPFGK
jgi:hypothetical protein